MGLGFLVVRNTEYLYDKNHVVICELVKFGQHSHHESISMSISFLNSSRFCTQGGGRAKSKEGQVDKATGWWQNGNTAIDSVYMRGVHCFLTLYKSLNTSVSVCSSFELIWIILGNI